MGSSGSPAQTHDCREIRGNRGYQSSGDWTFVAPKTPLLFSLRLSVSAVFAPAFLGSKQQLQAELEVARTLSREDTTEGGGTQKDIG